MTLRDLLKECNRNKVMDIIQKKYYPKEENHFNEIYTSYDSVWETLIFNERSSNKEYEIYIRELEEGDVDVCLYCSEDEMTYAMDFTAWKDLIDYKIKTKHDKIDAHEALAHILWEITFYGFSEDKITQEKDELKSQIARIESGEEELHELNLDDLEKDGF
tara:strand:- start:185 stop:667 length:483 start_codon:yes stop_codon:yes gene_type:complete